MTTAKEDPVALQRKWEEAGAIHRKWIDDVRRFIRPACKVEPDKLPPWLVTRLRAWRKRNRLDPVPTALLLYDMQPDWTFGGGSSWLDHWGTSKAGPFKCCHRGVNFVSEPYEFGPEKAALLNRFCEALGGGLVWHVSSDSWWYPMHTVRITIHEQEAK